MPTTPKFDPILQLVINAAPVAIAYIGGDQRYRLVNPPYAALHGKPVEAIIGSTVRDVVGDHLYSLLCARLEAALRGERIRHEGSQPIGSESKYRIVEYVPDLAPDGMVRGVVVVITDITDRKLAEDQLREAHEHLVQVMENMTDAFYTLDNEYRFTYINRVAEKLWGRRREDLLGKVIWEEFPNAVGSHPYGEHLRAAAEGKPVQFETISPIIGRWVQVTIAPIMDGISVYFHEISERKLREERLTILHQITAALSEALTSTQVQEVILEHARLRLGGHLVVVCILSEDRQTIEMIGHDSVLEELHASFGRFPVTADLPIAEAIRKAHPVWIESLEEYAERYPAAMQKTHPVTRTQALTALPLMIHGQVIGALGLSYPQPRDFDEQERQFLITLAQECAQALDRARLYEIEAKARAEAEKLNRLQTEFLAMISHELRTPLTSIKGFASTLLAEDVTFDISTQHEFIQIINDESDKLHNLIEQLLMLTRMQAGSFVIQPQALTVKQLLEHVMPQIYMVTQNHRPHIDLSPDLPAVCVDAMRIGQVVINLVENACKYSDDGSEVVIKASPHTEGVCLSVADRGPGIPAEDYERVFRAFYRGSDSTDAISGTGLGLAIARGILDAHGGRIWIEKSDHTGTTIAFTLPICE